jgi:hypothetical protein
MPVTAYARAPWKMAALVLVLMLAVVVPPGTAQGAPALLFTATYAENFPSAGCSILTPCVFATSGVGTARLLGAMTEQSTVVIGAPAATAATPLGCLPMRATTTFTSLSSGDVLTATTLGPYCQVQTSIYTATLTVQFTGGTGRFSQASGTGTAQGIISLLASGGQALWHWQGALSLCPSPACAAARP